MRKSTLFVSAMLTVFLMATMFGVVSAYQQVVQTNNDQPSQVALSQPVITEFAIQPAPIETVVEAPLVVTAEEATTVAVEFLGDPNVYSVEVVDYQGAPTYLVTFSSGDLVYVSSTGMVVANSKIEPIIVTASNGGNGGGNNGGNQSDGGGSSDEESHDDGDDHDDHDHDDDHEDHDD